MLSDEEYKAIKSLNEFIEINQQFICQECGFNQQDEEISIKILLNLIEKQSKEIEEYKECERLSKRQFEKQKNDIKTLEIEIEELKEKNRHITKETVDFVNSHYISKGRIEAKIEEYTEKSKHPLVNAQSRQEYTFGIRALQSLLEKGVNLCQQ